MTFSPFACATISAETVRFLVSLRSEPSPASRTSSSVTVSPASPASFSTTILSPAATRYCLPPVRTTANMALSNYLAYWPHGDGRETEAPRGKPGCYWRRARLSTPKPSRERLMPVLASQLVTAVGKGAEDAGYGGVVDGPALVVGQQVLLADIGDVA